MVLSPGEIASRVRALDTGIQSLDHQISSSSEKKVNESFREAWKGFVSRWQIERDNWLGSAWSRLFATQFVSRFDDFRSAYQNWLSDFQRRIPGTVAVPLVTPQSSFFGLPELSMQTVLILTGLAVGFFIYNQRKKNK
jgi:hypothetical protein